MAVGALTALFALVSDVPVHVASLRGGAAWLAVVLVARVAGALQARLSVDASEHESVEGAPRQ